MLCLDVAPPDQANDAAAWSFKPCDSRIADGACYSRASIDTVREAGRTWVRVKALLSGTIAGYDKLPTALYLTPLDSIRTVLLRVDFHNPKDTLLLATALPTFRVY